MMKKTMLQDLDKKMYDFLEKHYKWHKVIAALKIFLAEIKITFLQNKTRKNFSFLRYFLCYN